jgi:predicted helicase
LITPGIPRGFKYHKISLTNMNDSNYNINDLLRQLQKIDWDEELTKKEQSIHFLILKDSNVRETVDELIVWLQMRAHGVIVSKDDVVELIAVHLSTKPMFDAIFGEKNTELNKLHEKINKVLDAIKQYYLQFNYGRQY